MLRFAAVALVALLVGCSKAPVSTSRTDNSDVELGLLFSHGDCSVYRFSDAGRWHYFTDCRGSVSSSQTENCGKNCNRNFDEEIPTSVAEVRP